jgi:hypothetical protein
LAETDSHVIAEVGDLKAFEVLIPTVRWDKVFV